MSFLSPKENQPPVFNSVRDLYLNTDLPIVGIDEQTDFAIINLKDIHKEFPYSSPVFRPNFFSFLFVKSAYGKYTTDDQKFETVPGTIYFTNPGHFKSYTWEEINETYLVTFTESFLKENVHPDIFEEFPFLLAETVKPRVLEPEVFAEFESLYQQILKEYASNNKYRNKVIGNLFVVLLLKVKEYFWKDYDPIIEGDRGSGIVYSFKKMLEKHYRDLSAGEVEQVYRVQDYADAQQLHPNYLSNVIKVKTGKPIGEWIIEKTIAQAKFLLHHTTSSIKEIAYKLGFSEANYFSQYFKKYTELTPALYRKQLQI
nr:AraC family transcriptional regulator [Flavobacterium sp. ASV13]